VLPAIKAEDLLFLIHYSRFFLCSFYCFSPLFSRCDLVVQWRWTAAFQCVQCLVMGMFLS